MTCQLPDEPTPERSRHGRGLSAVELIPVEPNSRKTIRRVRFRDTCPLDVYHARGKIDDRQYAAGTWLSHVFWRACLAGHGTTVDYARFIIRHQGATTDVNVARKSFWRAMREARLAFETDDGCILTVRGRVVRDVCGLGEALPDTARLRTLRKGLNQLADYIKI